MVYYIARGNAVVEPYTLKSLNFTDVVVLSLAMAVKNGRHTASCLTLMLADGTFAVTHMNRTITTATAIQA